MNIKFLFQLKLNRILIPYSLIAALLAAVLVSLSGCENRQKAEADLYYFLQPQLPVVTPMKLDRAGAKYSMNFWVLPEQPSRQVRPFFIGFRSLQPLDTATAALIDVKEFLRDSDIPLEVRLTHIDAAAEKKIQLLGPPDLIDGDLKYTPLLNDQAPVRHTFSREAARSGRSSKSWRPRTPQRLTYLGGRLRSAAT